MILARKRPIQLTPRTTAVTADHLRGWANALYRPWRAVSDLIIARRTEQAEHYIESRLPMMSDAELARFGIARDQVDSFIEERRKARRARRDRPKPR